MRPVGHQTNEVVLDNVSAGVSFQERVVEQHQHGLLRQPRRVALSVPLWRTRKRPRPLHAEHSSGGILSGLYLGAGGQQRTNQLYRIRHTGGESLVRVRITWLATAGFIWARIISMPA